MGARLEDLFLKSPIDQADAPPDGDLIRLQMIAIGGLQEENNALLKQNEELRAQNEQLSNLNESQTKRRLDLLRGFVKLRGQEMMKYGQCFIDLAEQEMARMSEGNREDPRVLVGLSQRQDSPNSSPRAISAGVWD